MRPVIITNVDLLGITWPVELTLASRDEMGFRMLLGREAFREALPRRCREVLLRRQAETKKENLMKKPIAHRAPRPALKGNHT